MNTEKLKSFIKYAKTEMTHINCMADHFERYMESEIVDAKEYFTQQGLVYEVQRQPSDVEICKQLFNGMLNMKDSSFKSEMEEFNQEEPKLDKYVIGNVIRGFRGTVDPRRVNDIFEELMKWLSTKDFLKYYKEQLKEG